MTVDLSQRLDSGMTVGEAIGNAARWWNRQGRHIARGVANDVEHGRKVVVSAGNAPGLVIPGEKIPEINSGIFAGRPWEELTQLEKVSVARAWHHSYVRMSQVPESEQTPEMRAMSKRLNLRKPDH